MNPTPVGGGDSSGESPFFARFPGSAPAARSVVIGLLVGCFGLVACGESEMVGGGGDDVDRPDASTDARARADGAAAPDGSADATTTIGADTGVTSGEACGNGLDDDADGRVDEGCTCTLGAEQSCFPGLSGQVGHGPCRAGLQRCVGPAEFASWGACEGATGPRPELCSNGVDDDCDGDVDDGPDCECVGGEMRSCYDGPPATVGVGICAAGAQMCSPTGWGDCEGDVLPRIELCDNGLDDDCNGVPDDGPECTCIGGETRSCYDGPDGTEGVGRCHAGTETCTAGDWSACTGDVVPRAEICANGIDDDCDAMTDEGAACECATHPELCNGRDDDCDGAIDEGGVCPCLDTTAGTPWQEWLDDDVHCFGEDLDEDPDEFDHADVPGAGSSSWDDRSALGIDFTDDSTIPGAFCDGAHTGGVFTYFQTFVDLDVVPASFVIQNGGTDDGVQVRLYNSRFPAGRTSDAWTFFESGGRAELAPFMAVGQNRIVLIHIDDNPTTRALRDVQVIVSGTRLRDCP